MVTLQFIPYSEIEDLSSIGRIKKLLNIAKDDKIVLLQGRLKKEEEAELIKTTMEEIDDEFRGIELMVMEDISKRSNPASRLKQSFINMLIGDRMGFTIIGPAKIIKDIKRDPNKIQLLLNESKKKKRRTKKRNKG